MTTNFPSSIDAFTNPTSSDTLDNPPHDQQHADINDAMEAVQAKIGVDGSAVTSSLDYKVANQGLTFIKSVTVGSGVSSVTVTDAFSSTFENYRIMTRTDNATANSELQIRFDSITTGYDRGQTIYYANTTTPSQYSNTNIGYVDIGINRSGAGGLATCDILGASLARPTFLRSHSVYQDITGSVQFREHRGLQRSATAHTSFTLILSSGTISGGTIRVYGYNDG